MSPLQPTILVIIGITGDLAIRKLLPAITSIAAAGELPQQFRLIGVSRKDTDKAALLDSLSHDDGEARLARYFLETTLELVKLDYSSAAEMAQLMDRLAAIETEFGAPAQRLFYLSVPPAAASSIVSHLGETGVAALEGTRLLLEKPFGTDLASAREFVDHTLAHFREDQIYRIDHYLAKEMAQNIIVFRRGNTLFRRTWNRDFIERIDIIASETIGIEGRAGFYEQTGALRDLVQSHLLQLAALTLMDLPDLDTLSTLRSLRFKALTQLAAGSIETIAGTAVRGQYQGYRDEVKDPGSSTETYVSLQLRSADPNWAGVPITITTGKSLSAKLTEIRIQYRKDDLRESNTLTLKIAPNEGVEIGLWVKKPGYDIEFACAPLDFVYSQYYSHLPEAYEQVLIEAMRGDQTLFASSDEVLASWKILAPVQAAWADPSAPLVQYPQQCDPERIAADSLKNIN